MWTWYLGWIALSFALRHPALALGVFVLWALRGWLPDPVVWLRTSGRIQSLATEAAANPSNVRARRDLARMYLDRLRPRLALAYLDEARARAPDDAELLYLTGLARLRSGDAEGALAPLVRAVEIDPRVRFGEPYMLAAEALTRLGKLEEAEDALERYLSHNSSSVKAHVLIAEIRAARGDRKASREAIREALSTWSHVPGYRKRAEIAWWLRAQLARAFG